MIPSKPICLSDSLRHKLEKIFGIKFVRVVAKPISKDEHEVKPMALPSGKILWRDFKYKEEENEG